MECQVTASADLPRNPPRLGIPRDDMGSNTADAVRSRVESSILSALPSLCKGSLRLAPIKCVTTPVTSRAAEPSAGTPHAGFDEWESKLTRREMRGTGKMALDAGIPARSALVRFTVPRLFNGCHRVDWLPPRRCPRAPLAKDCSNVSLICMAQPLSVSVETALRFKETWEHDGQAWLQRTPTAEGTEIRS